MRNSRTDTRPHCIFVRRVLLGLAISFCCLNDYELAQAEARESQEIIVCVQKREGEKLVDVPVPVAVLSAIRSSVPKCGSGIATPRCSDSI